MPLHEYECSDCKQRFEVLQKFSDDPVTVCTHCGGPVTRLIFPPAIQFKGTGWYVTDYAKKSQPEAETTTDEKRADGKGKDGKGEGEKKPAETSQKTTPSKETSSTSSSTPATKSTKD